MLCDISLETIYRSDTLLLSTHLGIVFVFEIISHEMLGYSKAFIVKRGRWFSLTCAFMLAFWIMSKGGEEDLKICMFVEKEEYQWGEIDESHIKGENTRLENVSLFFA